MRKHTDLVVIATGSICLTIGILIGVGLMWLIGPSDSAGESGPAGSASASASAADAASASASASASDEKPPPATGPKSQQLTAYQKKLAELRKKVKGSRAKQMDPECQKYFKTQLPAGYVYDGGKFAENEFVANASGCKALAKASKAPWFCCRK